MPRAAVKERATQSTRPLSEVATDIREDWKNVYFGAVPYLDAMSVMTVAGHPFGSDNEWEIIIYFLSNATTWRGETARRIKAELKGMKGR